MAKKETGLKGTLSLGQKVPIVKTTVDVEKAEAATRKIHAKPSKKEGRWVRITTDLPEDEYIKFKTTLLSKGKGSKGQEVVRELINSYSQNQ